MLDTSNPLIKLGITAVVCTPPAIASTIYRLWIRRGRYWADDVWALAAALSQLLMFTGVFIHITDTSPHGVMIASYYLMAATFYTVVWFSRLSILFSIIRIDPNASRRRVLHYVAAVFFIITVIFVAQLWWVCEPMGAQWKNEKSPQCSLTDQVVIMQLVTDVLSDLLLIMAPLRLLRGLKDKTLRRRLTVIFSTCLITTVVSLVHAAFILIHAGDQEVMAAIVEDCVSLIVSNVPVVVTALLAIRRARSQSNTSGPTSNLRFATLPANHRGTVTGQTTTLNAGTTTMTTVTTGWANPFRWERDLRETDSGSGSEEALDKTEISHSSNTVDFDLSDLHDNTTSATTVASTKGIRIDREVYVAEDTHGKKPIWHFQVGD